MLIQKQTEYIFDKLYRAVFLFTVCSAAEDVVIATSRSVVCICVFVWEGERWAWCLIVGGALLRGSSSQTTDSKLNHNNATSSFLQASHNAQITATRLWSLILEKEDVMEGEQKPAVFCLKHKCVWSKNWIAKKYTRREFESIHLHSKLFVPGSWSWSEPLL